MLTRRAIEKPECSPTCWPASERYRERGADARARSRRPPLSLGRPGRWARRVGAARAWRPRVVPHRNPPTAIARSTLPLSSSLSSCTPSGRTLEPLHPKTTLERALALASF